MQSTTRNWIPKKIEKHIIVGLIFVIILLFFKILLIPRIQNLENNKNNIKMTISYKQDKSKIIAKNKHKNKKNLQPGKSQARHLSGQ